MKTVFKVLIGIVLSVLVLAAGCTALVGGAASEVSKELEKGQTSIDSRASAAPDAKPVVKDIEVIGEPSLTNSKYGWFGGTITLVNNTDETKQAFVTINVFKDSQQVATINGNLMMKPLSQAKAELSSVDDYLRKGEGYTDYTVDISSL